MRWLKALLYYQRIPEVHRCFEICQSPVELLLGYLKVKQPNYPQILSMGKRVRLEVRDFHDLVTVWVVFCRNEYLTPKGARTVLDLGANIGCFSLKVVENIPAAQVISLEPFPETFKRLTANMQMSSLDGQIEAWPLGVAGKSGKRIIPLNGSPSQSLGMLPQEEECSYKGEAVEIDVLSLEEIIDRACLTFKTDTIDFVKMDIEGGEHEVIIEAPFSTLQRIQNLGLEYHPNQEKEKLFETLIKSGFYLYIDQGIGPNAGVAHFVRKA